MLSHESNKWDVAKDIICTESRQHERSRGQYTKRKLEYWNHGITETRKQKRSQLQASHETTHDDDEIPGCVSL